MNILIKQVGTKIRKTKNRTFVNSTSIAKDMYVLFLFQLFVGFLAGNYPILNLAL